MHTYIPINYTPPVHSTSLWQQGGLSVSFTALCNNISVLDSSFHPDWAQTQRYTEKYKYVHK